MWARLLAALGRLRLAWSRRRLDEETQGELDAHLDLLVDRYLRAGHSPDDARVAARRQLGNSTLVREDVHRMNSAGVVSDVLRDTRYALRGFLRTPGFTATVVLILAVGIGANAAIFSIVDELLLGDLPYPDGEQLVAVYDSRGPFQYNVTTPENWVDWQRASRSFSELAAWSYATGATLTGAGEPVTVMGQVVSVEFLPVLGVQPMLGRTFRPEEDQPNAERVIILSYGLWQGRFGRDPDILGRTIELDGTRYAVVGVMPEGFGFIPANGPADVDYWRPFGLNRSDPSSGRFIFILGRLRPGVTPDAAQTEMAALNERLAAERGYGEDWQVNVAPLQADRVRDIRTSLLLLFAAVGALVLLACFNVAGLLLARGVRRRQEMAIRISLGAGRAAIIRQLLTEGLLLALAGAGLGLFISRWTVGALVALTPIDLLETTSLGLDGTGLLTGRSARERAAGIRRQPGVRPPIPPHERPAR